MIIRYSKGISKLAGLLASQILKRGGIIIYPTETSYGLGAIAKSRKAITRIFKIKKRPRNKRLPVIVADKKMAKKFFYINKDAEKLIDCFMPGPLTLVVKVREKYQKELGCKTIAFRISSNEIARALSKAIHYPLISTSANLSGERNIYKESEVLCFQNKVDLILLIGNLKNKKPSTIYDTLRGEIIRMGDIKKRDIERCLNK